MLAILTTHPIQYQVPIWKALAARGRVPFKVYFMSDLGVRGFDAQFGRNVAWDIDLLSGYDHEFIDAKKGPAHSFWRLRLPSDFGGVLKAAGTSILWVQGWQVAAYWQAVLLARSYGFQTWLRAETNLKSTGKGPKAALRRPLLAQFLKRIDRYLTIGAANQDYYRSWGIEAQRMSSAPYCVDNTRFARAAATHRIHRREIRATWDVSEDAACVLFTGKLIAKKRPADLVGAATLISQRNPLRNLHLLFAGTGELGPEIAAMCSPQSTQAAGPKPRATFAGFMNQSEIAKAYVAADCLVLPSIATETWGLVVNEAMASGLPAIVSDACGCSDDLVKPHRSDLCFPVGNILALADAIEACLDNPPSAAALARIIDRYDMLRTVETVEALYEAHRSPCGAVQTTADLL